MAFDYDSMKKTSKSLLTDFGTKITLKKLTGNIYNKITKKNVKTYRNYIGIGVKLGYSDETIGKGDNVIQAGDVRILCLINDDSIEPVIVKDQIIFGKDTFNIINAAKVDPEAKTTCLWKLQCRRQA